MFSLLRFLSLAWCSALRFALEKDIYHIEVMTGQYGYSAPWAPNPLGTNVSLLFVSVTEGLRYIYPHGVNQQAYCVASGAAE